jgi:Family of unknown function (DUF6502)
MSSEPKNAVHEACRIVLRPLASMLLRVGMTWKEFSDLAKSAFVESATAEYGIGGRPTNISRVSILTGISRKEVKRQRDLLVAEKPVAPLKTTDASRVLSGWFQDSNYLDESGQPRRLAEFGEELCFETLCRKYSGDIAATTMLKELLSAQSIARDEHGKLYPITRYYQPSKHDDANFQRAVRVMRDLTNTLSNNIFDYEGRVPRFEGMADNWHVSKDAIPEFYELLDKLGQEFLEQIDEWLSSREISSGEDSGDRVRLGVDLFAIQDKINKE